MPTTHSRHAAADNDGASLRRVPSIAPTLPDGAERMLERLHPHHGRAEDDDEEEEDDENNDIAPQSERPQFVLGEEVESKGEVQHNEVAGTHQAAAPHQTKDIEDGMEEVDLGDQPKTKTV